MSFEDWPEVQPVTGNDKQALIDKALKIATRYGGIDGAHHKDWVIDQMVRALTACPINKTESMHEGALYEHPEQGESEAYKQLVAEAKAGEEGPETYDWEVGIPP